MKIWLFSLLVVSGLLLVACTPAAVENIAAPAAETAPTADVAPAATTHAQVPAVAEVSFSKDIWPILEKYALAAHGGKGGVFLEGYKVIMNYVVPGKPEESPLYQELTGKGVPQMPPGNPLPSAAIQLFYDWIKQGAKNN